MQPWDQITMDEPIAEQYRRVVTTWSQRVAGVPAGGWDRPSPCTGWVARDVVSHLVEWVPAFVADGGGPALPAATADPVESWVALDAAIRTVLDDPVRSAATIDHPHMGRRRFDEAIGDLVLPDVLVHTWDLARATGQDEALDAAAVHLLLERMEPLDEVLRASGQFGPRVEVPSDADEQTRLIAFTGRQP